MRKKIKIKLKDGDTLIILTHNIYTEEELHQFKCVVEELNWDAKYLILPSEYIKKVIRVIRK